MGLSSKYPDNWKRQPLGAATIYFGLMGYPYEGGIPIVNVGSPVMEHCAIACGVLIDSLVTMVTTVYVYCQTMWA